MRSFYIKAILYWFILLMLALINAGIREFTYKPFLTPHIGMWAHQLSTLTGIIIFFIAIYFFLKHTNKIYSQKDLIFIGTIWIFMTLIFETSLNIFLRGLTISQTIETYYFWNGETWVFVLISLIISPLIADRILKTKNRAN